MPLEFNEFLKSNGIPAINLSGFSALRDRNKSFGYTQLRTIANHATRHFGFLLLAESGANAQHLASIDCTKTRLNKALGVAGSRAIKGRSNYEEQEQFVDIRFASTTWKQYLRLRTWMTKHVDRAPERGLFLIGDNRSGRNIGRHTVLTQSSMKQLTLWPRNAPPLTTRNGRKHKAINFLTSSNGNTIATALALTAKPKTIERHYAFNNTIDAARQISQYFEAQAQSAELRMYCSSPINISVSGESISSGRCSVEDEEPELAIPEFLNLGIQPRCGAPITCIFCTHYTLHADEGDLLLLLTMRHWISIQSRANSETIDTHFEKFLPFQNRIDQIINDLENSNADIQEIIKSAQNRFENGERDEYWNAKINALLEAGGE